MAHYNVRFSCGHEERIELFGKTSEREKRIAYYEERGICPACYREKKEIEKSIGCDEIEMPYRDYKLLYAACKTKAGSYNGITKTIIVYVPKNEEE